MRQVISARMRSPLLPSLLHAVVASAAASVSTVAASASASAASLAVGTCFWMIDTCCFWMIDTCCCRFHHPPLCQCHLAHLHGGGKPLTKHGGLAKPATSPRLAKKTPSLSGPITAGAIVKKRPAAPPKKGAKQIDCLALTVHSMAFTVCCWLSLYVVWL